MPAMIHHVRPWLRGCAFAACLSVAGRAAADTGSGIEAAPIFYGSPEVDNRVDRLQARLDRGEVTLTAPGASSDSRTVLAAVLRALQVEQSSQTLVFSKTSFQQRLINPANPRALYFGDDVYLGWVPGSPVIELSAVDRKKGLVFYTMALDEPGPARFVRRDHECLQCHASALTRDVPGSIVRSVFPDHEGFPIMSRGSAVVSHATPIEQRWGGWVVTGAPAGVAHRGNATFTKNTEATLAIGAPESGRYLATSSDFVALMVLEHQITVHNLIAAADFSVRRALHDDAALREYLKNVPAGQLLESTQRRIAGAVDPLVDALLLIGEAPLPREPRTSGARAPAPVSPFAAAFQKGGPRDRKNRSLRELGLPGRLFRYPCSYLISSAAFDALPEGARQGVYRRMFDILTAKTQGPRTRHLTPPLAQAVVEILRDTKRDLPGYFKAAPAPAR